MGTLANCSLTQENVPSEFTNAEVLYFWNLKVTRPFKRILKLLRKLNELKDAVEEENKEKIKEINNWFHQDLVQNKEFLSQLYKNHRLWKVPIELLSYDQCTTQNDLILAACRTKRANILFYILNETDILVHLSDDSLDVKVIKKQRTEAFRSALNSNDFKMVEMLYDYWCGNLHWVGYDLNNIKMLREVFLSVNKDPFQQLGVNFKSLIMLNDFQIEVYTELDKLKLVLSENTPEKTATMILKVLQIYYKHSSEAFHRNAKQKIKEKHELKIKDDIEANSHLYVRSNRIKLWEVFFRKLDFNITLLILENIYIVRKHLKKRFNETEKYFKDNPDLEENYIDAVKSYKEFESELYHFIHRTSENWCVYSSRGWVDKLITFFTMQYDTEPIRCLERETFKQSLKKFENILQIHCINPALVGSGTQRQSKPKVLLDENYLQPIQFMCDHYSLTKVVKYIEAVLETKNKNFLIMERVLQVIGEMLKSTDESHHLSRSTQALLRIAISVETVRHLHNIRDFLSKADEGQLGTRINIENTKNQTLYNKIKEELEIIKQYINFVIDIHNFILDKSLFEKNYDKLEKRIIDFPTEVQLYIGVLLQRKIHINGFNSVEYRQFYEDVWKPTGLSASLLEEIRWIEKNKKYMLSNVHSVKTRLSDYVVITLPSFLENVKKLLELIKNNNANVNKINKQLVNYKKLSKISICPNDKEISKFQNRVEKWKNKNKSFHIDTYTLSKIKDYEHDWDSIKRMLTFCIRECGLKTQIDFNLNEDSLPKKRTVRKVKKMLKELKDICEIRSSNFSWWKSIWYGKSSSLLKSTNFEGIEKLVGYFKEIKQDDPRIARKELLACLIERLNLLKQILLYPQQISLNQHIRRFNNDLEFRIILEMILADIANVLVECKIRLMNKSSKLLTGIDMGNVLDHGNPFLDVISIDLKSNDFAAELVEKAMMFAEDTESIEALYKLFIDNVDYETIIYNDSLKMTATQQRLFEQFKKCENWESYAKLTKYKI